MRNKRGYFNNALEYSRVVSRKRKIKHYIIIKLFIKKICCTAQIYLKKFCEKNTGDSFFQYKTYELDWVDVMVNIKRK